MWCRKWVPGSLRGWSGVTPTWLQRTLDITLKSCRIC
jgi:hypothetical protein